MRDTRPRSSHIDHSVRLLCRAIDCFDHGQTSSALATITYRHPIVLNGLDEILKHSLMPADVAYDRRRRTLILVPGNVNLDARRRFPQICRHNSIVLQNDCAFRASDFESTRISRVSSGSRLQNAKRTARELEDCDSSVFSLNRMQRRRGARLDTSDVAEQPKQQINGMDALVYQCTAAIERQCSAPPRIAVIVRRPIPFHVRIREHGLANHATANPLFESADVRF